MLHYKTGEKIMVKKSFLQNIWNVIVGVDNSAKQQKISASQAETLQKNYLESQKKAAQLTEYPPYIDVARQLFSEKNEIFRAAVFYLGRIAENEGKYAEPIVKIMQQYAATAKRNPEDMEYLAAQINQIEKNIHFNI